MKYIAFLYKDKDIGFQDKDDGYNVVIPDVQGAYTCGDSFEHSVSMAKECLDISIDETKQLPKAHRLSYFTKKRLKALDIPDNAIPQILDYTPQLTKRTTVNFKVSTLKTIDEFIKKHNIKNRSLFLEQTALKTIKESRINN